MSETTGGKKVGATLARALDAFGFAFFPLAIGVVIGFYMADQGMPWTPTLVKAIIFITLLGLAALFTSWLLRRQVLHEIDGKVRLRKRVAFGLLLALAAAGARFAVDESQEPSLLTQLSQEEFNAAFRIDTEKFRSYTKAMDALIVQVERAGFLSHESDVPLTSEQEELLINAWVAFRDLSIGLDTVRWFYEDYWRFDPSRLGRSLHLRSFLLSYASELALVDSATKLTELIKRNKNADRFLDAAHPSFAIPPRSFSALRQQLIGVKDQGRVFAGHQYLHWLDKGLGARDEADALGLEWLWQRLEQRTHSMESRSLLDRIEHTVRADTQPLENGARNVWFPMQKGIAKWMGDTRTRRIGWYLINEALQDKAAELLEPGDILLSRKNWHLSNVGLPGFWPHAILYIGSPQELTVYLDDPSVAAWVKKQTGKRLSFPEYLKRRFPQFYQQYQHGTRDGPHRVIEGIADGVVLNPLSHAAGDYLAGIRPRLSKLAKAQAISDAFGHLGKLYDYDFDFATDDKLVCTELVWRSYRPGKGKAGLEIPLISLAGRRTLPANNIAELFASESRGNNSQLDFVLFIDAREASHQAFLSNEEAFIASWERPQWDILQE